MKNNERKKSNLQRRNTCILISHLGPKENKEKKIYIKPNSFKEKTKSKEKTKRQNKKAHKGMYVKPKKKGRKKKKKEETWSAAQPRREKKKKKKKKKKGK
jgi:hypothetical protein